MTTPCSTTRRGFSISLRKWRPNSPLASSDRFGRRSRFWRSGGRSEFGLRGETAVLSACDFVRARVYSREDIVKLRARIDGKTVAVATPTPLPASEPSEPIQAWMANCWMDLSTTTPGRHELQLYFEERGGGYRSRELMVWVAPSPARPGFKAVAVDCRSARRYRGSDGRGARQETSEFSSFRPTGASSRANLKISW